MTVIKKTAAVGVTDRRIDERVPCLFITQANLLNPFDSTQFDIECLNISTGGLAFRARIGFEVGERIAIKMQFCNRDGQLLLCEVRHCTRESHDYRVGVQTLESITALNGEFVVPAKWLPEK